MRFERVRIADAEPAHQDTDFLIQRRQFLLQPPHLRAESRRRAEGARPGSALAKLVARGLYADEQPGEVARLEDWGRCRELNPFG